MKIVVLLSLLTLGLQGCAGAIVGTTVDVAIEVVKVPFKVAGAALDLMTDDEEEDDKQKHKK